MVKAVKNTFLITDFASHLRDASERIESLTRSISSAEMEGNSELVELYTEMRYDELQHAQQLMIRVTDAIIADTPEIVDEGTTATDESAFAEGELTHEKTDEKKGCE